MRLSARKWDPKTSRVLSSISPPRIEIGAVAEDPIDICPPLETMFLIVIGPSPSRTMASPKTASDSTTYGKRTKNPISPRMSATAANARVFSVATPTNTAMKTTDTTTMTTRALRKSRGVARRPCTYASRTDVGRPR